MRFIGFLVLLLVSVSLSSDGGVAALCSSPYCPPPWRAFQGHCYLWVDKPMSWMDAERYCQMLSHPGKMVHLASIHSEEEDEFIKMYVRKSSASPTPTPYWIGCSDIEQEGHFRWSDGSDVSYEGWWPGEPNNVGEEDCTENLFQFSGKWNDVRCMNENNFVCKR
ncbi:echinoidin-like [Patiria miniata]|uniref:C-type lectin domain-containing protein n=1 Tax=Patiria miniata TaxID=46514 RepID=A0A914BR22_PATMI|nr:echinoidin-like [Patiria miniata]